MLLISGICTYYIYYVSANITIFYGFPNRCKFFQLLDMCVLNNITHT